jgi:hypothetical protein
MVITTNTTHVVFASALETSINCLGGDFDCPDVFMAVELSAYVAGSPFDLGRGGSLTLDAISGALTLVCQINR